MRPHRPHTSGPWLAEADNHNPGRKIYSGTGYDTVICDVHDYDTAEGRANAWLIAAAPELLSACHRLNLVLKAMPELYDRLYDTMGYVEAAIAKAEGKITR